jgi:hypothetical protein
VLVGRYTKLASTASLHCLPRTMYVLGVA